MEPPDPLLGRVIAGKLKLLELLGSGAMGKVYRAHHEALDKTVAIKVLHQKEGPGSQIARRFKAEARAASRLDHPNSLRILDFGEDGPDGLLYIAMEFLDGEDLSSVLRREGRLDSQRTAMIMSQALAALAVAHQQGVVHRDMKPGNIMLLPRPSELGVVRDVVKVCDFGLAKVLDAPSEDASGAPLTKQGAILGTPAYMSPEQASGEPTDYATDIYSCGVILYAMLSGRPPFSAESATGLLMKHILEEPVPLASVVPGVDPRLAEIAHRAMAKKKEQRFASAREMLNALREVYQDASLDLPPIARSSSSVRAPAAPNSPSPGSSETSDPFANTFVRSDEKRADEKREAPAVSAASAPSMMAPAVTLAAPSVAPQPAGSKSTVLIAVLGSIALFGAGVAAALLIPRGGEEPVAVTTVALPIEEPAKTPPSKQEPPKPEPARETPEMKPVIEPMTPSGPMVKPKPRKEKKPVEEPKAEPPPQAAKEEPPKHEPAKEEPAKETPATEEPAKEQPKPVEVKTDIPVIAPPKIDPKQEPAVPQRDEPKVSPLALKPTAVEIGAPTVEILSGAISKTRAVEAFTKQADAAKRCLETVLLPHAPKPIESAIKVSGRVDAYGKFLEVKANTENPKLDACVVSAMQGARLRTADTGDAQLVVTLKYRLK